MSVLIASNEDAQEIFQVLNLYLGLHLPIDISSLQSLEVAQNDQRLSSPGKLNLSPFGPSVLISVCRSTTEAPVEAISFPSWQASQLDFIFNVSVSWGMITAKVWELASQWFCSSGWRRIY